MSGNPRFNRTDIYQNNSDRHSLPDGSDDVQSYKSFADERNMLFPEIPFMNFDGRSPFDTHFSDAYAPDQSIFEKLKAQFGCGRFVEGRRPIPSWMIAFGIMLLIGVTGFMVIKVLTPADQVSLNGLSVAHASDQRQPQQPEDSISIKPDSDKASHKGSQDGTPGVIQTGQGGNEQRTTSEPLASQEIVIHIVGQVAHPGVYKLPHGSRINDALEKAGGLTAEADISLVNLAQVIHDGERIKIPYSGEELSQADRELLVSPPSAHDDVQRSSTGTSRSYAQGASPGKININTAGKEQLCSIPGVGDKTADSILEYRQKNGRFAHIEDIEQVSGIGPKKFEKMKNYLTVS